MKRGTRVIAWWCSQGWIDSPIASWIFVPIVLAHWSRVIDAQPQMLYEAHSRDYQTAANCAPWARWFLPSQGWPGAEPSHAQALFALDQIESELLGRGACLALRHAIWRR